jgi:hypothetical protein
MLAPIDPVPRSNIRRLTESGSSMWGADSRSQIANRKYPIVWPLGAHFPRLTDPAFAGSVSPYRPHTAGSAQNLRLL